MRHGLVGLQHSIHRDRRVVARGHSVIVLSMSGIALRPNPKTAEIWKACDRLEISLNKTTTILGLEA